MKRTAVTLVILGALVVGPRAFAHHEVQTAQTGSAATSATLTEGEVRKVDKAAGTITLKHGEIRNLRMSPMTMVFRVSDKAMLDAVATGEKVRFAADVVGGALTITRLDIAK